MLKILWFINCRLESLYYELHNNFSTTSWNFPARSYRNILLEHSILRYRCVHQTLRAKLLSWEPWYYIFFVMLMMHWHLAIYSHESVIIFRWKNFHGNRDVEECRNLLHSCMYAGAVLKSTFPPFCCLSFWTFQILSSSSTTQNQVFLRFKFNISSYYSCLWLSHPRKMGCCSLM